MNFGPISESTPKLQFLPSIILTNHGLEISQFRVDDWSKLDNYKCGVQPDILE